MWFAIPSKEADRRGATGVVQDWELCVKEGVFAKKPYNVVRVWTDDEVGVLREGRPRLLRRPHLSAVIRRELS